MKKFLFMAMAAIMMVLVPTQVDAQGKKRPDRNPNDTTKVRRQWDPAKMAEQRVKMMTESLKLTEEQQTKLTELFKSQTPNFPRQKGGKRQKMTKEQRDSINTVRKAQMEKFEADIKSILTEEQYAQYQKEQEERMKAMQERRNKMMQRMPGNGENGGPGEGRPIDNDF